MVPLWLPGVFPETLRADWLPLSSWSTAHQQTARPQRLPVWWYAGYHLNFSASWSLEFSSVWVCVRVCVCVCEGVCGEGVRERKRREGKYDLVINNCLLADFYTSKVLKSWEITDHFITSFFWFLQICNTFWPNPAFNEILANGLS